MAERGRPVYCTQCGSIVDPGDNFCGVCGARVLPDAQDAAPTQNIPTQVPAPPGVPARDRNLTLAMLIGIGVVLVLVLGIGSVAALNLLRGEAEPPKTAPDREEVAMGVTDATKPKESTEDTAAPKPAGEGSETEKKTQPNEDSANKTGKEPAPEEASGPAPGYNLIKTPDGSLTVEVRPSWGVETGEDSEKLGGPGTWSYYAEEYLTSSITTASSLDAWYGGGGEASGAYIVASRALAQKYTDDELIHSLLFEGKANRCTAGPYEDYNRPPYSGKIQTWYDCGVNDATFYTVAAAPEGRECVAVLDARVVSEADREAVQHLLDTFEVDCGLVTSEALASPSASPSPTATATPSPTPTPSPDSPEPSAATGAGGDLDCDDFASQGEAQAVYEQDPSDPHGLDADGDGSACEWNPEDSEVSPTQTPTPSPDSPEPSRGRNSAGDLDCDDFSSQAEAQEVLEDDPSDPHGLDGDGDGEACEG
jgi:hypothetical protein